MSFLRIFSSRPFSAEIIDTQYYDFLFFREIFDILFYDFFCHEMTLYVILSLFFPNMEKPDMEQTEVSTDFWPCNASTVTKRKS